MGFFGGLFCGVWRGWVGRGRGGKVGGKVKGIGEGEGRGERRGERGEGRGERGEGRENDLIKILTKNDKTQRTFRSPQPTQPQSFPLKRHENHFPSSQTLRQFITVVY